MLKPSDVFVPGRFPIREKNVFADRGSTQRDLELALKRGFVPIVYGSYGVGKSSLARYCTKDWETDNRLVYIESLYGKTLANVFERVLEVLGYEVTVERHALSERETTGETGFELEGGMWWGILKGRLAGKLSRRRKKALGDRRELLIKSPTDAKVLDLCEENRFLLLLDEVHRSSDSLREELSAFLKAFANRNPIHFKLGLIGTEIDASKLVVRDPGIDRLLQEVPVKTMSEEEARAIIFPGMEQLGIDVPEEVASRVVRAGVGSPFIVQYLCLEMAEECSRSDDKCLSEAHFKHALSRYAQTKAQRMIRLYRCAIETTGPKRYRKQILHAMARCDDDYVTMEQITAEVSRCVGQPVPSTTLSGPLRTLKTETHGNILTDVSGAKRDTRAHNYSAFTDPAMKSIIRMIEEMEEAKEEDLLGLGEERFGGRGS